MFIEILSGTFKVSDYAMFKHVITFNNNKTEEYEFSVVDKN